MPRKPVETSSIFPYHIFARSNNKDWFSLDLEIIFFIYAEVLDKTTKRYGFLIHSFVLMSNHFHMMISTPEANISKGMRYFMTETSRKIARESKRINRIYGARYGSCIIKSSEHYAHAYKYVYRNPVEAKICSKAEEYPWSSLSTDTIPICSGINGFETHLPSNINDLISWVNQIEEKLFTEAIRLALYKRVFKITRNRKNSKMPVGTLASTKKLDAGM